MYRTPARLQIDPTAVGGAVTNLVGTPTTLSGGLKDLDDVVSLRAARASAHTHGSSAHPIYPITVCGAGPGRATLNQSETESDTPRYLPLVTHSQAQKQGIPNFIYDPLNLAQAEVGVRVRLRACVHTCPASNDLFGLVMAIYIRARTHTHTHTHTH